MPSPALSKVIVRGLHEVWDELGIGLLESVYEAALAKVLADAGLFVQRQHGLDVHFRDVIIGTFRADLLVERQVLVELKVAKSLLPIHDAQVLNYLRCSRLRLGILANYSTRLEFKRLVV